MERVPLRERARKVMDEARTRVMEVGRQVWGKMRVQLRRGTLVAAGWLEKRAHQVRKRLQDPTLVSEPLGMLASSAPAVDEAAAPTKPSRAGSARRGGERRAARTRKPRGTRKGAAAKRRAEQHGKAATTARARRSESMKLYEVGRDAYACLQEDRGLGTSNSGLVNRGGGLVIDTFWDLAHTRQLIEQYAQVWKEPARRVVNTHHNGDHCWGNQLFPGAEIIGHRLCAEAFARESPEIMQAFRNSAGSEDPVAAELAAALREWDFSGIELRSPTTLVEDRLDIDLDDVPVQIIYVGPAHTAGDLIVYLPEQRVVFAGDVVFRFCTPIGWEGTYKRWMQALEEIAGLEPQVVVPGHGPLCGVEGVREMREYLVYVYTEARRFFEAGLTEMAAARRIDLGPYSGWTQPERIVFQVARAYREFRGEPYDTPLDVATMIRGMHELRHDPLFGGAHERQG